MRPLRFAVVGCGAIARTCHLPALRQSPAAELVAVVDSDLGWAREVARRFGASHACSAGAELGGRVDAAIVATPNGTHASVAVGLLQQGIHVLCEKPLCTTVADAQRLLASAPAGTRLMPAHVRRFQANLRLARQMLDDGVIGEPQRLTVSQSSLTGAWSSRTAYRSDPALAGGGVLIELGVHLIDLALWFCGGRVAGVESQLTAAADARLETDAQLALRFAGGATAEVSVSERLVLPRLLRVEGSEGWLSVGLDEEDPVVFFGRRARVCRRGGAQRAWAPGGDPFARQIDEFVACVRGGAPFPVPDADVLCGLEIIARAYADRREAA
jgi:predicted dehydrogenase